MKRIVRTCLVFGLLALSNAHADDGSLPSVEYQKLQRPSDSIGALGPDLFGEKVDLYTGKTEFRAVDISIPGNSKLPVQLSRKLEVSEWDAFYPAQIGLADWEIEVPQLSGTFDSAKGWKVNTTSGNQRCSSPGGDPNKARPPDSTGNQGGPFPAQTVWHGYHLVVPGEGNQEMVVSTATTQHPSGATSYPWTTKNHWVLSCISSLVAGGSGEGFLAIAPDGTKYTFNRMITRAGFNGVKNGFVYRSVLSKPVDNGNGVVTTKVTRSRVYLVATRVDDRFGNWVTYNYDSNDKLTSITSSDSRTITLTYSNGLLVSATDGTRTWTYTIVNGKLTTVTQPDSTQWTYASTGDEILTDHVYNPSGDGEVAWRECIDPLSALITGGLYTLTIGHPSGATGYFEFNPSIRGKSYVPDICDIETNGQYTMMTPTRWYPDEYSLFGINTKRITGPGLPTMTWSYAHSAANSSFIPECQPTCATSVWTEITAPDGSKVRSTFGNKYNETEGQLQKVETFQGATLLKQDDIGYYAAAASSTTPFPVTVGTSPNIRATPFLSEQERPQTTKSTTQDGVTFNWAVTGGNSFDGYAHPTSVTRSSSLGYSKIDLNTYENNASVWVLGQLKTVTDSSTGLVETSNVYNATTATLTSETSFGVLKSSYTYFTDGNINTVADGAGHATTLSSYYRGIARTIAYPTGSSMTGVVDALGRLASITDEKGYLTGFAYDAMGRLSTITPPTGDTVAWANTTSTFAPVASTEYGLPAGHYKQTVSHGNARKEIYFDAMWRPVLTREYDNSNVAATQRFIRRSFDHNGRETFTSIRGTTDALTTGLHHYFDALGRPTSDQQDSELGLLTTSYAYLTGFQTQVTNPRGFATTTSYQVFDTPDTKRPMSVTSPEGVTTTFTRDVFGKPLTVTRSGTWNSQPQSLTRRYVYDASQRLCQRTEPETNSTLIDYDSAGNLAWSADGQTVADPAVCNRAAVLATAKTLRSYDNLNRLTTIDYPGTTTDIGYTYEADGALSTLTRGTAVWTYAYNKLRLPVTEQLALGARLVTISHAYNTLAQETTLTTPSGLAIAYAPNALGQASTAGTYATGVAYFANGGMSGFSYGNGATHAMTQNVRLLPSRSLDQKGATVFLDDNYTYDANANVASITDGLAGNPGNRTMGYDGLDRLTSANAPNLWVNASYGYDALDNVRTRTLGVVSYTETVDAANRLSQIARTDGGGTWTYASDAWGQLTQRGAQTQVFDAAHRMTDVTGVEHYDYDGWGRRVKITDLATSHVSYPVYSMSGQLVFERDERANTETDYISLNGSLVAKRAKNLTTSVFTTTYLLTDALGSPVAELDSAGTLLSRERYQPWGEPQDGTWSQGPGYTGHVTDANTHLSYMQQRYYDPFAMRFISPDPVPTDSNTSINFNRFRYAENNPYAFVDPDGRFGQAITGSHMNQNAVAKGQLAKSAHDSPRFTTAVNFSAATQAAAAAQEAVGDSATESSSTISCSAPDNSGPLVNGYTDSKAKSPDASPSRGDSGSIFNNPHLGRNITIGEVGGATLGAGVGVWAIAQIIGFPEIEGIEGVGVLAIAAGGTDTSLLMAIAGEPVVTPLIVGGTTGAAFGGPVGGAVGAASTSPVPDKAQPEKQNSSSSH